MKFVIPDDGKTVSIGKKLVTFKGGEFETKDKELQEILKNCKGVSEVKAKKAKEE